MLCGTTEGRISMNKIRTYSELKELHTFIERFEYLKLGGKVGADTFGFERYLNQAFYNSQEWKQVRDAVILRDNGCDLGIADMEIHGRIIIHHINPVTIADIRSASDILTDPEFLICVSHYTHNAIHYGSNDILPKEYVPRRADDTCPWKK